MNCILLASYSGFLEIIKYLVLEKGCSLKEVSNEGTCIMNAARNDYFENLITNSFETLELECSSTGSLLDFTFPTFAQFL